MDLDQFPWFAAFKLRRELYSVTARGLGQKGARPEPQHDRQSRIVCLLHFRLKFVFMILKVNIKDVYKKGVRER